MTWTDRNSGAGSVQVFADPDLIHVMLSGEVDLALADDLDGAYDEVAGNDQPVQLDVYRVGFLDSIGVGFIGRLIAREHGAGRRLALVGASRSMRETLTLAGLADRVDGLRPRD